MDRIARLGVAPGAAFWMAVFNQDVRAAIEDGIVEARQVIRATSLCAEADRD